jgi:hypothetical protein
VLPLHHTPYSLSYRHFHVSPAGLLSQIQPKLHPAPTDSTKGDVFIIATQARKGKLSPIWLHASGQRCKKDNGALHYFGTDYEAALKRFADEWDDIKAGVVPPPRSDDEPVRLRDVVKQFLAGKRGRVNSGELSTQSWSDYDATCAEVVAAFGCAGPSGAVRKKLDSERGGSVVLDSVAHPGDLEDGRPDGGREGHPLL